MGTSGEKEKKGPRNMGADKRQGVVVMQAVTRYHS